MLYHYLFKKSLKGPCISIIGSILLVTLGIMMSAVFSWAATDEVIAVKVKTTEAPVIDGKIDTVWNKVRGTNIPVAEGYIGNIEVSMKALYTDTHLYLLFRWKDSTESYARFFEYDGKDWNKIKGPIMEVKTQEGKIEKKPRDISEDRLGIMWNISDSIKDFDKKGCDVLCHNKGEYMLSNGPNEIGDMWHWKSQRTNMLGYADDQYLINIRSSKADYPPNTGRRNDAKTAGGDSDNWDKNTKRPLYKFPPGKTAGPFLYAKEAVKITEKDSFKPGDRLPREVLESRPTGSRGDIEAKGVWRNGEWTLEIKRALNTGNKDDVQFTDLSKPYLFGLAVHDNSGDEHHSHTGDKAYKLILKK